MNWTEEDTEILQLMNRVRQVCAKVDPKGYARFTTTVCQSLSVKVGGYTLELFKPNGLGIYAEGDRRSIKRSFKCEVGPARPSYIGDLNFIKEVVLPVLDAEMVLDDLSLLGDG